MKKMKRFLLDNGNSSSNGAEDIDTEEINKETILRKAMKCK